MNVRSDFFDVVSLQAKYSRLQPLQPLHYSYVEVDLIIGQDAFHAIRPLEYFETDSKHAPIAVRLPLGWVLSGPLPVSSCLTSTCFKADVDNTVLADQVKSWYDIESFGAYKSVDPRSKADTRALRILENTTFYDGNRYQVGMLWAEDNRKLPNNYFSALVQLKSLEIRLSKNSELKASYSKTINDDIEKGYIVQVPPHNPSERTDREWYLPHHAVVNPHKPGKVRRVLNGAAKFHGCSLNKSLLTGPDLLQSLLHVLFRFREHSYAVSADIEGMFMQVGVPSEDQRSLRFLWREDPTESVVVYQYTRHIFGAKDSPTCSNFALQRTASDNETNYPDAALAVKLKFYMDDYLDSVESEEKAVERAKELVALLEIGGFKLTKFVSNIPSLMQHLKEKATKPVQKTINASATQTESTHVLGLNWNYLIDTLVVSRGMDTSLETSTSSPFHLLMTFASSQQTNGLTRG